MSFTAVFDQIRHKNKAYNQLWRWFLAFSRVARLIAIYCK